MRKALPLTMGIVLLGLLWLGPLPDMARRAFSPHMILHLGVAVVAAPIIAIGVLRIWPETQPPSRPILAAGGASAFEFAVVWGWHLPLMHEAAARETLVFVLQQLSFLFAGLFIWWVALSGKDRKSQALGAFTMLFTAMHMAMLGLLLVQAPGVLYAAQFCLGAFGLDPLQDQQFGGGLMAFLGALPFVIGGAWLASQLARDDASSSMRSASGQIDAGYANVRTGSVLAWR